MKVVILSGLTSSMFRKHMMLTFIKVSYWIRDLNKSMLMRIFQQIKLQLTQIPSVYFSFVKNKLHQTSRKWVLNKQNMIVILSNYPLWKYTSLLPTGHKIDICEILRSVSYAGGAGEPP